MSQDLAHFGNDKPFAHAMTWADHSFQCTHDHLSLFVRLLASPVDPLTSSTIMRSLLESAAMGAWVVDSKSRHRYTGVTDLRNSLRIGQSAGKGTSTDSGDFAVRYRQNSLTGRLSCK